mmetsp:Transcript_15119/g.22483  ORF Transcript_15119/g.22483 Transcript_15119/m.22483 type:complete len:120 (+) Transcript_15119:181-540(+)
MEYCPTCEMKCCRICNLKFQLADQLRQIVDLQIEGAKLELKRDEFNKRTQSSEQTKESQGTNLAKEKNRLNTFQLVILNPIHFQQNNLSLSLSNKFFLKKLKKMNKCILILLSDFCARE